jgi:integrase
MTWVRKRSKKTARTGWQHRFIDPVSGRRMKKTFWYPERQQAEKAYAAFLEEREKIKDGLPGFGSLKRPFAELVERFLNEAPLSSANRQADLKRLLMRNPLRLNRVAELFDKGRLTSGCKKLADGTYGRCCFRTVQVPLKQLSAWAASVDLIPYDPLHAWKKLPWLRRRSRSRAFTPLEVRTILDAIRECDDIFHRKHSLIVPVLTLLVTGNRNSAVFGAKISDLETNRIRLPEGNGKKRNGAATLPHEFVTILKEYIKRRPGIPSDAPLLVSPRGTEIDRANLLQDFRRAMVLAFVKLAWPNKPEYSEVEPVAVAHRLFTGKQRGNDGPPPKDKEKIIARRQYETLVEAVAAEIGAEVHKRLEGRSLYSMRKTHITWARQFVNTDAVKVQVGHAPQDVEERHYLDQGLVDPAKASAAVWDVLLGRLQLHGTNDEIPLVAPRWTGSTLELEVNRNTLKSGPIVAPDPKTDPTTRENEAKKTAQRSARFSVVKISPAGLEPTTSGLGNQRSIQLSYGDITISVDIERLTRRERRATGSTHLHNLEVLCTDKTLWQDPDSPRLAAYPARAAIFFEKDTDKVEDKRKKPVLDQSDVSDLADRILKIYRVAKAPEFEEYLRLTFRI